MAAISEIRKRAGLLVAVIGVSMIAFLLMDALSSNSALLNRGTSSVGEIAGEEISPDEFERRYSQLEENYKTSRQTSVDEQARQMLRDQAWNQLIQEYVMKPQFQELGIHVSSAELQELILGENPHPAVVQQFTNPETGRYDPAQVELFLRNLGNDPTGETRKQWQSFEKFIKQDREQTKYMQLIKKGIYIPGFRVRDTYIAQNKKADIEFVQISYAEVPDDQVEISDADLSKYLNENKEAFRQEGSRTIEYITFPVIPSAEDTARAKKTLADDLKAFKTAEDDSIFINLYSEQPFDNAYYTRDQLTTKVADTLFKVDTGTYLGPFFEEGAFKVIKVLDRRPVPDSAKVRHILVKAGQQRNYMDAKVIIDSLRKQIEDGETDFASLAQQQSEDPGSAAKGGELGWIEPGEMVPAFNNAVFYRGEEGKLITVPSQFGFHLIEVQEIATTNPGVKFALLQKSVLPGSETDDIAYRKASEFTGNYRDGGSFAEGAKENDLNIRTAELRKTDRTIMGLGRASEIIRWAFDDAEISNVSHVFSTEDAYVVTHLVSAKEEGIPKVNDIREQLMAEVLKNKKGEIIKSKLEQSGDNDLQSYAEVYNADIMSANGVLFAAPYITGIGNEPQVVGRVFSLNVEEVSGPVSGASGVFAVKLLTLTDIPELQNPAAYRQRYKQNIVTRSDIAVFDALKNKAKVKDYRYKFY